jgi:hypothetical protein
VTGDDSGSGPVENGGGLATVVRAYRAKPLSANALRRRRRLPSSKEIDNEQCVDRIRRWGLEARASRAGASPQRTEIE